jgi:hypothetical protein
MNLYDEHLNNFIHILDNAVEFKSKIVSIIMDGNNEISPNCLENFLMKLENMNQL